MTLQQSPSMTTPALTVVDLSAEVPNNVSICSQVQTWSDEYDTFSRIVNGYLTAFCVAAGSIGNVMSVKQVRFTNFDRNRGVALAVAIIVLAFWDTILLLCALAYYGAKNLLPSPPGDIATRVTPLFHAFSQIANTASIWSVVTITVQRYMATRDPFRTTRWLLYVASTEINEYGTLLELTLVLYSVQKQKLKNISFKSQVETNVISKNNTPFKSQITYRDVSFEREMTG